MVTLHHFVHPTWFERLGGFTREANIPLFVAFAQIAFRWLLSLHIHPSIEASNQLATPYVALTYGTIHQKYG